MLDHFRHSKNKAADKRAGEILTDKIKMSLVMFYKGHRLLEGAFSL